MRRALSTVVAILLACASLLHAGCAGTADEAATTAAGSGVYVSERRDCPLLGSSSRARYVSNNGSNSNPGTLRRPWRTIQRAFNVAAAGETIWVRAGIYRENVDATRDGTVAAPITLKAFPREQPTIRGRLKISGSNVRVAGLVVTADPSASGDVLVYVSGGDNVELRRNEIRHAKASGIYVGDASDGSDCVRVVQNWIHGNGTHWNLDHGIYFGHGRGGLVAANIVERNRAYGVHLGPGASETLVTQNTIVGNGRSGVIVAGYDKNTSNANLIVNNVIAFNAGWGIRTFWETEEGTDNAAWNNLVYANARGATYGTGLVFGKNISANPRFVGIRNYRLRQRSPAIDRADAPYTTRLDRDGNRRPRGARPDLGAFER